MVLRIVAVFLMICVQALDAAMDKSLQVGLFPTICLAGGEKNQLVLSPSPFKHEFLFGPECRHGEARCQMPPPCACASSCSQRTFAAGSS